MRITKRQLRRIIKETTRQTLKDIGLLQKGDKVMVSKDGLSKYASLNPNLNHPEVRDRMNTLHAAYKNKTMGRVIMITPDESIRVDFDGHEIEVDELVLERI